MTFSRAKLLKDQDSPRVYYGPGQTPNACPELGVVGDAYDLAAVEVMLPYRPPTDWSPAGSLLRVPQVVWLSALYPGSNFINQDATTLTTGIGGSFHIDPDPDGIEPYTVWWAATATLTNHYRIEFDRLTAAFTEAKTRVEALRPGRTFVSLVDWQGPDGAEARNHTQNRYTHVLAPAAAAPPYFGTDFLHLYAGHFAKDVVNAGPHPLPDRWMWFPDDVSTLDPDDLAWTASRARVVAAWPRFAGYATDLYGPLFAWHDQDGAPFTAPEITKTAGRTPTANDRARVDTDSHAALRTTFLAPFLARDHLSVTMLTATAADLAAYGFTYRGLTTDLTTDALVARIAAHYQFDPATGANLPPA